MSRAFTFVHAADLHLDAPFQGISAEEPRVARDLLESTYAAFERVVDVCLERGADFLVLAGDIYNTGDKSLRAQLRFQAQMQRLADADVRVFIASGNHDPASGWSAGLDLPECVREFPTDRVERVVVERDGEELCAVYGRGYATRAVTENLAVGYRRDEADRFAVGVLHANVGGQPGYEPYAPCSLQDLRAADMDYWALGHIHKPSELSSDPPARYAGSPQGLNPNEDGQHGCLVVTVSESRQVAAEFVATSRVVWSRVAVDLSDSTSIEAVRSALRAAGSKAREDAGGVPAIVRVDLIGRTEAHAELAQPNVLDELVADVREEQLAESPWVWVDRVRDITSPVLDLTAVRGGGDFAADLVSISDRIEVESAAEFVAEALSSLSDSIGAADIDPAELIERARDACLDRLLAEVSE